MEYTRKLTEKLSVEQVKIELLHTAYGNNETFLAKLDPRTLFIWYLYFGIAPWFIHNQSILIGLFVFMAITTFMSKVTPLVIIILCLGLLGQGGYLLIASWFFGGDLQVIVPLLTLTLKLSIISLASITVFCSMDPEKLSNGLLKIGVPGQVSFSIAYGYRMLPSLLEEYHHVFLSFRLRGKAPEKHGILYWRSIIYFSKIAVLSFYPLLLSTAKRARTTVEALETKGSFYAFSRPEIKKIKLAHLHFQYRDYLFLMVSVLYLLFLYTFVFLFL
ncbi:energy-coupling factor transporter transmembrane component T family protein [Niallia sp. Sow4_A1]|jgi:energy-coupling factor transport system permease protein|uniref:Energy-coupling factor transporter transmembrane component T n=1 Tax=Niallia hominis TaxID=3133173 RepID=A0ABV1F431_9BACI|nr:MULTISPECIES: energy-coupling factor transporter transmembrane component T [Bacillaceae]MCF2650472.1 energy-coupling factor transporter transmembrane protein EcfT [Niallia circulans]CAI9389041.1 Energy-coupling factor transporter transmembrane protein EcfT [Bacillus sp. T2.9-1]